MYFGYNKNHLEVMEVHLDVDFSLFHQIYETLLRDIKKTNTAEVFLLQFGLHILCIYYIKM